MEQIYNKLVRDKIPEIIKSNGEEPITRILNEKEYKDELEKKLNEEYQEVLNAIGKDRIEELADMLEIIKYLAKMENSTLEDINLLISYKLSTVLDYAKNLPKKEIEKTTNYVKMTIPDQINDYKIIIIEGKKVGCLLIEKYQDAILLSELYLVKNYRRKGLGTNILNNILKDNSKVYLWVYKENLPALHLYQQLGFKIKDTTENRYFMEYDTSGK